MRNKFNEDLLRILDEEEKNENSREERLRQIIDSQAKDMLDRQFGIERAKASQRIIDLSAKHEIIIADFIRNNLSHD